MTPTQVPAGPARTVDFLLTGAGQLVTCDPALGEGPLGLVRDGAVAAAGGRVVYAGPEAGLADLAPAHPRRIGMRTPRSSATSVARS